MPKINKIDITLIRFEVYKNLGFNMLLLDSFAYLWIWGSSPVADSMTGS